MARNKTLRTRDAGKIIEKALYTRIERTDDERVRAAKRKKTNEIMQRFNQKTSVRKFELLLAANFRKGDIVGTVTYDDEHLPRTRTEANRRFKYFRNKLEKHYRAKGIELVVFWSTEHKHGDGRWHHHFVIPACGKDFDLVRKAWIYGSVVELEKLRLDNEKNYATLAAYFAKEARDKLGLRSWTHTRNAKKPQIETQRVDNDYQLQPPKGVQVLERICIDTPYGTYQYLKYMLPDDYKPHRKNSSPHK